MIFSYAYSLCCQELDENIDTFLICVHCIWSYNQQPASLAEHKGWQETAGPPLSKGNKILLKHLESSPIISS